MDSLTPEARSKLMARIRSKDTMPEIIVRSVLHRMGFRFRIHCKNLPGHPDIVLPKFRKIVLVHGCFWHGHACRFTSMPKSNETYWQQKIMVNKERDTRTKFLLEEKGWTVLELWECKIGPDADFVWKLMDFLAD